MSHIPAGSPRGHKFTVMLFDAPWEFCIDGNLESSRLDDYARNRITFRKRPTLRQLINAIIDVIRRIEVSYEAHAGLLLDEAKTIKATLAKGGAK